MKWMQDSNREAKSRLKTTKANVNRNLRRCARLENTRTLQMDVRN